ncbi:ABC transporter permease subunit [Agrobacterium vitis]|uniref:ABC transporter permease subunit n=1 Tax=Agrobacterium vitis TaxID=373 RepID=A0ABD6GB45_AGRVI|nr:ABC transporter permease [Agrobacterium vitis]MUO78919.1 ABC transporter permease subunit [Agrobacterium vitis]MUO94482.1 ABC transporter permease subunit [Agrobacterium vitis]MUP06141.1 ABC transporter permease subunit [Agrobacterium vitis]MUZ82238.1 ABC transporter permease subunit [Agrobacterium vitis]MVA11401.1 ABC transporter permease subunit [Agrobacterium vitis]
MDFSWIGNYWPLLLTGAWQTLALLVISVVPGFVMAIGLAFAQVSGGPVARVLARGYSTFFRGTPLLIQLWLLYYGVGSLLPMIPGIRQSLIWPLLREGFFFAAVSFTLNYAAYEAEVLRGALLAVPKGELEAGRAFGMGRFTLIRRVWLPRAIRIALPTIAGEVVMQLKATPLAFTVTVMDLYAVAYKVRQDTLLVYEPLIVVTLFYLALTAIIARCFRVVEAQVPIRR